MKISTLFRGEGESRARIPTIVCAPDESVYAFANLRVGSSRDDAEETRLLEAHKFPGENWSEARVLARLPGWSMMIGSAVADENTGKVMCFFKKIAVTQNEFTKSLSPAQRDALAREKEKADGDFEGDYVAETSGKGEFTIRRVEIAPSPLAEGGFVLGNAGFSHGSGSGITLRHGPHAGRLVVPARFSLHEVTDWAGLRTGSSNTVIYSDDHGLTWHTGGVVQPGTGEGCLSEIGTEGAIFYNSRAYFGDALRYGACSYDGGESFVEQNSIVSLMEPCCNADMCSLPSADGKLLLFSNPRDRSQRIKMTLSLSEDAGKSWQPLLTLPQRCGGYSSLVCAPGGDRVYLLFECGEETDIDRIDVAEIPLSELIGNR